MIQFDSLVQDLFGKKKIVKNGVNNSKILIFLTYNMIYKFIFLKNCKKWRK